MLRSFMYLLAFLTFGGVLAAWWWFLAWLIWRAL
jgi:hypothetical protein